MFRQPAVVDLVSSSSSDEDDVFPVRPQRTVHYDEDIKEPASPDHHFHQLDEPMEIEEDEPFEPVVDGQETVASVVNVASALESVLKDLESDEDEEFAIQHDEDGSAATHRRSPSEAIDLSRDDSDNDEDFQRTPSCPEDGAQYSHDRSTDDATAFFSSMDAVVMKSKYEGSSAANDDTSVNREEGELSDDPSQLETDESWQQKQMEATFLREAQVAHRQASLRNLAKTAPSTQPPAMSKKKQRKLKRKLQEAAAMTPGGGIYMPAPPPSSLNMGYPPHYPPHDRLGMAPPARRVYRSLPPPESSILRVHRHVVMDDASLAPPSPMPSYPSTSPNHLPHAHHVGPPPLLPGPNAMQPPVLFTPSHPPYHRHVSRFHVRQEEHIHPPLPPPAAPTFRHAPVVITPPVDSEPTPPAPSSPDLDPSADDLSLLESLRNAVKRSLKKPKVSSSPPMESGQPELSQPHDPSEKSSTQVSPPRIQPAAAPTPVPSRSPSPPPTPSLPAKMALGPNSSSYSLPKYGTTLKPLTACTQTVKIQLSTEDCNMMRRRMLQIQSLDKVSDPIANLKQKIAAREVELLLRKKSTNSTPSSAAKNPEAVRPPNSTPPPEAAQDNAALVDAPSPPAPASPPANEAAAAAPATQAPSAASATMTIDPVAVAQSHITRLEKRIGELKHLISQKELQLVHRSPE